MATTSPAPTSIDRLIGRNVQAQRQARGISTAIIAEAIGMTDEDVQEFEHGDRRIAFRIIQDFARALEVAPISLLKGVQPWTETAGLSSRAVEMAKAFDSLGEGDRETVESTIRGLASRTAG